MRHYSTYEAKARLSEILRLVRDREETVVVSYHGRPIAEIGPVKSLGNESLEDRLARFRASGVTTPPREPLASLARVAKRPGALRRFLDERAE
jgi:prevent-host-death family protein